MTDLGAPAWRARLEGRFAEDLGDCARNADEDEEDGSPSIAKGAPTVSGRTRFAVHQVSLTPPWL